MAHEWSSREVQKGSFSEALAALRSAPLLGPAYVILGGLEPNEGAILERSAQGLVPLSLWGGDASYRSYRHLMAFMGV